MVTCRDHAEGEMGGEVAGQGPVFLERAKQASVHRKQALGGREICKLYLSDFKVRLTKLQAFLEILRL